jgi:hypothetical protein
MSTDRTHRLRRQAGLGWRVDGDGRRSPAMLARAGQEEQNPKGTVNWRHSPKDRFEEYRRVT